MPSSTPYLPCAPLPPCPVLATPGPQLWATSTPLPHATPFRCHTPGPQLWDHCFTAGPDYFYYFLVAYLMAIK